MVSRSISVQLEVLSKVCAFGLRTYWKAHIINKFDVLIAIASSVGEVVEATSNDSTSYSTGVAFLRCVLYFHRNTMASSLNDRCSTE